MIDNLNVEDIDALLSRGQICAGKFWRNFFIGFYIFAGLLFAVAIGFLIGVPLSVGEFDFDIIITIVCFSGAGLLIVISVTLIRLYCRSIVKKTELFLNDAVLLNAQAKSLGEPYVFRNTFYCKGCSLEVSFTYNGVNLCRQSKYKDIYIFSPVFYKYVNKSVYIAYSPTYDEVMLIKPDSLKKLNIE
ncbi:MAG: hypothetical protein J1F33_04185 [Clostridiales bacterium]|nr:hypothetical protein [Clostridiales bacterium]